MSVSPGTEFPSDPEKIKGRGPSVGYCRLFLHLISPWIFCRILTIPFEGKFPAVNDLSITNSIARARPDVYPSSTVPKDLLLSENR